MKLMTSVLVTVVLTLLVAGTSTAGPGGFPFEKCFSEAQKQEFKKQLCTDLGQTEDFCKSNKQLLKNCKNQIMSGPNAQSIIQASVTCLQTVANITVPAANTGTGELFKQFMKTVVANNQDLCSKGQDIMTCFKQNTGMAQLMKDCIAKAGK
ncbi:uncharacterized protein [Procambarus clarkii]|uniref:uncharacterized protein n=1 Tax=Procambarus clarkii TaxID=6728 RepID=UPI001E672F78|nr:uncharacterized protein LOC123747416 [Procambarus clarkii]